jgi:hypothetical protein
MIAERYRWDADKCPASRAISILSKSKIPAIRKLTVEVDATDVVLRGQVALYYYKQLAQELVRNELPEIIIRNRIEVVEPD